MVDEVFIEEFSSKTSNISFALHFFGIPADDSLGFPETLLLIARSDHLGTCTARIARPWLAISG